MWKKRLPAYIIDMIVITIIINLFGLVFPKWVELEHKSQEQMNSIFTKQTDNGEQLTDEDFDIIVADAAKTVQKYDKEIIIYRGLEVMIIFGYFIILPLCMNGQTLGKKLFKIRVKGTDDKLTYTKLIIRTLLITDLGVLVLTCMLVYILPAMSYFAIKNTLEFAELVILIISFVKIVRNEKHMGLHDIIAKTEVVEI